MFPSPWNLLVPIFCLLQHFSLCTQSNWKLSTRVIFFFWSPPPPHLMIYPPSPSLHPSQILHLYSYSLALFVSGIMQKWGSLSCRCGFQSHFLQCSDSVFPLLTHTHSHSHTHTQIHVQTHVHMRTHAHTFTFTWNPCFFTLFIFSMAHAERVISAAWCPPLEKWFVVPAGTVFSCARPCFHNPLPPHLFQGCHRTKQWIRI